MTIPMQCCSWTFATPWKLRVLLVGCCYTFWSSSTFFLTVEESKIWIPILPTTLIPAHSIIVPSIVRRCILFKFLAVVKRLIISNFTWKKIIRKTQIIVTFYGPIIWPGMYNSFITPMILLIYYLTRVKEIFGRCPNSSAVAWLTLSPMRCPVNVVKVIQIIWSWVISKVLNRSFVVFFNWLTCKA